MQALRHMYGEFKNIMQIKVSAWLLLVQGYCIIVSIIIISVVKKKKKC